VRNFSAAQYKGVKKKDLSSRDSSNNRYEKIRAILLCLEKRFVAVSHQQAGKKNTPER
jgi:hypothetical protein